MPDYSIYADFDRDGRISMTSNEYQQRNTAPGTVIIPNLDKESRRLPLRVTNGQISSPDWKNRLLVSGENDLTTLVIKKNVGASTRNCQLILKVAGKHRNKVRLYNHNRQRIIRMVGFNETLFEIPPFNNSLNLYLQLHTLVGAPETNQSPTSLSDFILELQLLCVENQTNVMVEDTALVSISPILFMDNNAVVERLYMCEIPEIESRDQGNTPSLRDMIQALRGIGNVGFIKVPLATNLGDSWLQDQFQVGYCQKPRQVQRIVVHLPRMRSNVVITGNQPNLANFVSTHFISRNIGLFQGFWERTLGNYIDANGRQKTLSFSDSFEIMILLSRFWGCWQKLIWLSFDILSPGTTGSLLGGIMLGIRRVFENKSLFEARNLLDDFYEDVNRQLGERGSDSTSTDSRRRFYRAQQADLTKRYNDIKSKVSIINQRQVRLEVQSLGVMIFSRDEAEELDSKIFSQHDSTNYGGNIEVTPPLPNAPFGKILVGSAFRMDGDLVRFLATQQKQPVISIDTSWLDVAHVDEVVCFVSNVRNHDNAFFYASPGLAMEIMRHAFDLYRQGLPSGHPGDMYRPLTTGAYRTTDHGNHPVTKLLRGKFWWHHHPQGVVHPVEPPKIYRRMAEYYNIFAAPYEAGERSYDRYYDAGISIKELLYFGSFTNEYIEEQYIQPMKEHLSGEAPGVIEIPLPVMFDKVIAKTNPESGEEEPDFRNDSTTAFTPDLVNMQIVNGHLFIPKPFGPRMGIDDAIHVLRQVMPDVYHSKLNSRYFTLKGLHRNYIWMKSPLNPGTSQSELSQISKLFKDGFPEKNLEEVENVMRRANQSSFDRSNNLRSGWRKLVIPENTVDLFETYTQIVAESLHLQVHFIDSWYYHVRLGGIHCGTNTIRRPGNFRSRQWWDI